MPEIYENALKSSITRGEVLPVYVLHGDDSYLVNHYEKLIIDKTCGSDNEFDLQKFERDVNLQDVFDSVNQFSMLGGRKCVVLSDYDFESASKNDFDRLIMLLSENYETSTLVLKFDGIEFDPKHSARAKKIVSAAEKGGGASVILNHRSESDLIKMLINGAKRREKTMDVSVAKFILQNCGTDINMLVRELEKLCYFATDNVISKNDVDLVCTKSVDASVYEFVKTIISLNTLAAINMLNDLLYMRVEPMIILYTVAASFIDMSRVSAAKSAQKNLADVVNDFSYGGKAFVVERAANNLRKFSEKTLTLCMNEILNADKLLKSYSQDEKHVLEEMTVNLIYIIANGESIDKA